LYRIANKIEPRLDDSVIQQRIDQRLLERHFFKLTAKYIKPRLPAAASAE